MRRKPVFVTLLLSLAALLLVSVLYPPVRNRLYRRLFVNSMTKATVEQRLEQFGPAARQRLGEHFARVAVSYPPQQVVLVGIKDTMMLEVWARQAAGQPYRLVRTYPVLKGSGKLGPKLREGDGQVPEGLYRVESLNPNSRFHLSLRVNYPNEFDRRMAAAEGRDKPGSDIMIHGSNVSIGCLAMGDEVAEELFVLAGDVGVERVSVILTPVDLRRDELPEGLLKSVPAWMGGVYEEIRRALDELRA